MRAEFADELRLLAHDDQSVVLLTGDLGFAVLESFASDHPDRFFNVGVAEQNMLGIAAGMAEAGYRPFVYSIATFASMRGYEFLRNGAALHQLPVRVVGMGGGLDYGHNGVTHYALEDVALMRVQPSVTVVAPADADQARAAVRITRDLDGPVYFRLCKTASAIPGLDGRFRLWRLEQFGSGDDVALIGLGEMAATAATAGDLLRERGIDSTVAVLSSLNPSPVADLAELLGRVSLAVTIESHYLNGAIGSLVAEVIAEEGLEARLIRRGVAEMPRGETGSPAYLYERNGLSAVAVADVVSTALELAARP
ncbi:MAG: transketolase family protein [Sciscionella sp.]